MNTPRSRFRASRRLFALATLIGGLIASEASAATYYLSPNGNDGNTGSSANPWATINKANSALRAGDVCIILPGTYSGTIEPSSNGSPGARITYVGSLTNPGGTSVGGIDVYRAYITVKGVKATGTAVLEYLSETSAARNDSIAYCIVGGLGIRGAKNSMIARNTVNGSVAWAADHDLSIHPFTATCMYDTLRRNTINAGFPTWNAFIVRGWTSYCLIDSNRVSATFGEGAGRYLYTSYNNTFRDNHWAFEASSPPSGDMWVTFYMRDSSQSNLFERDTMLCGMQSGYSMGGRIVNAGVAPMVGGCINNTWRSCIYKTTSYMFLQDKFIGCTIENSTFASRDAYALWGLNDIVNCKIRNNLFYSGNNKPVKIEGDILPGTTDIKNNIFYAGSLTDCASKGGLLIHNKTSGFTENNNLFFARSWPVGVDPSTMSILYGACSRPGVGQPWYNATGMDGNSKWGSPQFVDSTFAGLDPHLRSGSLARGLGAGGVDAGPYPFGSGAVDNTPPGAVANLGASQVSDHTLLLSWTAPGDDGANGTVSSYDLRWSLQPIDATNFGSATPVAVPPAPAPGGSTQSYVMASLNGGTRYYFALKARDEANNVSALSNVLNVTTSAVDVVGPATIQDLNTSP
jgi:Pel9A-like, right handed beta helix region/Fibronectin type III domain